MMSSIKTNNDTVTYCHSFVSFQRNNLRTKYLSLHITVERNVLMTYSEKVHSYGVFVKVSDKYNKTPDTKIFNDLDYFSLNFFSKKNLNFNKLSAHSEVIKHVRDTLSTVFDITIRESLRQPAIILAEYIYPGISVNTNVGNQVTDVKCTVQKRFYDKSDITLFERTFINKSDCYFSVDIVPVNPIREYRDKDYLDEMSEDGSNDATWSLGASLDINPKDIDYSYNTIERVMKKRLLHFSPFYKKRQAQEREKKGEPWTNRMLVRKYWEKSRFGIYTAIHPFYGDPLSGWTRLLGLELSSDDEDGLEICFSILGLRIYYSNERILNYLQKKFIKHKPHYSQHEEWKQWKKEHPKEYFLYSDWSCEIAITRAKGLYWDREFEGGGSSKWGWKFNILRNKFWNLI